ncbi:unnamed protein product, partial [Rotaria socialis]
MIQDKINQQYKEFQMEVDRLHGLVNFNREHLIRSLANHMETKVSDVMKKQLEKDEIDEFEINRARNEFVHIQQLFDILCKQPLISVNNGVGNELILNAPRATLRNLNVDGFNWTEETSTKNPSPIIDFSNLNQVHVEDTIIYQSTNSPPPPPPRSRNPRLEEIIANHHDREDLSLKFMALTGVDMEIVAYYAILRNA